MNESLSPETNAEPVSELRALVKPPLLTRRELRWRHPVVITILAALAFLTWQWLDTRNELRRAQEEFARRVSDGDTAAKEARVLASKSQEAVLALQAKVGALDARVAESHDQQAALESLYQEFSRARDERALADVEQAINIAEQQLQLASNVPAALTALQSADSRLAMLNRPQLQTLRKLITRDIERLKALPLADVASMSLQLDGMLGRIDSLPLAFEHAPIKPKAATPPKPQPRAPGRGRRGEQAVQSEPASAPAAATPGFIGGLLADLWAEFSQLIRIERLDRPDPVLLSPQNAIYLRENLRLRLLSARLALMQRDGKIFNEDVAQSRVWLERYFDIESRPVTSMLADLKQIEGAKLIVDLPSLSETGAALRSLKLGGTR